MTGQEFADTFSKFINGASVKDRNEAVAGMLRDHRTLQQSTMRFFIQYVEGMAQQTTDARNEASVQLATRIVLDVPDHTLPFV